MNQATSKLYFGTIMHRRYFPKRHGLSYKVGNLFIDIDELEELSKKSWAFGYNRKAIFSIHDRHFGEGKPLANATHAAMADLKLERPVKRIFMFCYPAVFGKVFNPLTVYFGYDAQDEIAAVIYEVSNTFGQRHSYAMAIDSGGKHQAQKQFYVSPYNPCEGNYHFSFDFNANHMRLNIALFENDKLKLCARFEGEAAALNDRTLAKSLASLAWQPFKVMFGIHYHALRLYLKGLKIVQRPDHPKFAITTNEVKP